MRFKQRKVHSDDEIKSGVFEKPHQIVMKTVMVNGEPQQHLVKVYEPTRTVDPACNPVKITSWTEGIVRSKRGSA